MGARAEIGFRLCGPDDAPALTQVLLEAFATYAEWAGDDWSPSPHKGVHEEDLLVARLGREDTWCLVADASGRAVGYVALTPARTSDEPRRPIPGLGHVWHLWVVPEFWGTGVATRLLAEAMREAVRRGYEHARLWTPRDNARARAFYRREGWRESGAELYAEDLDLPLVELRRPLAGVMLDA